MPSSPSPASTFLGPARLTLRTSRSAISVGRYRHARGSAATLVTTTAEDAFLAIFQLRSHAPHRVWQGGQAALAPCAAQGALHIIDLNTPFSAEHDAGIDSLHVHLPRAALDDLAVEMGAAPVATIRVPVQWSTPDTVIPQFQASILDALAGSEAPSRLYADQLVQIVARHIAYTYGGMRPDIRAVGGLAPWQARRSRALIASRLTGPLTIAEVAAACGLSSAYFARAFKASTGTTPHEWLQACRVERARGLLRRPSLSLAAIAAECGFADQSHFTRIFRRATGQPPGNWRDLREPLPPASTG